MKLNDAQDGGRHVRSARKQAQRDKAKANGGALAQRRTSHEAGRHLLSKKESPVRRRNHKKAADALRDIMLNGGFSGRPVVRL